MTLLIVAVLSVVIYFSFFYDEKSNDDDDDSADNAASSESSAEQSGEDSGDESGEESFDDASDDNSSFDDTADIPYSTSYLSEAIQVWSNYSEYGVPCELGYGSIERSEIAHLLTNDQKQWVSSVAECIGCNSIEKVKQHLRKYMSNELAEELNEENLISYSEKLYLVMGGVGRMFYETDADEFEITRVSRDEISVSTNQYNSAGDFYCKTVFDFEYIDGAYKIVKVSDLVDNDHSNDHEEQIPPRKDFSVYCGDYTEMTIPSEPAYGFRFYSYDNATGMAKFEVWRIGYNYSPYYFTGDIYAYVGDDGTANFAWTDSWSNKGVGSFKLCGESTRYVELVMTVTEQSNDNRSTLSTNGTKIIYKDQA